MQGGAISDGGGDSLRAELVSRLRARLRRARRGRLAGSGQVRAGSGHGSLAVCARLGAGRRYRAGSLFQKRLPRQSVPSLFRAGTYLSR